jgi:hypothetical protein
MITILFYIPIIVGAIMLIFAKPVGVAFCKLGKALWKAMTFGMTDLAFLYREDKAPMTMRLIGGAFIVFGIMFLATSGFPFKGPNKFKAMSEAKSYLDTSYGRSSDEWSFSTKNATDDSTILDVTYDVGQRSGVLHAEWTGDHYKFTEKK